MLPRVASGWFRSSPAMRRRAAAERLRSPPMIPNRSRGQVDAAAAPGPLPRRSPVVGLEPSRIEYFSPPRRALNARRARSEIVRWNRRSPSFLRLRVSRESAMRRGNLCRTNDRTATARAITTLTNHDSSAVPVVRTSTNPSMHGHRYPVHGRGIDV